MIAFSRYFDYHDRVVRHVYDSPLSKNLLIIRRPDRNRLMVLGLLFLLSGCSTYQNITGYFNTYYNASKLFSEAVADVEKMAQKDRDTNYFAAYKVPPVAQTKFDKVIEKCSKLIQFYPQSSWVEDGIMMIGKSYYYLGEYEPASRKFRELMENFPASGLRYEAKLWNAKAQYCARKDDEALKIVKELFPEARADGKEEVLLETLMLEAQIYLDRGEYEQAAATNALAVEVSGDDKLRGMAQYQLAASYEKMGEKLKAANAYARVAEFGPDYAMEFNSRLQRAIMLSEIGHHDEALQLFDDLMQDQLKAEEYALTELEIAKTYWKMKDSTEAFALFSLIDSTYRRTDAAAKAYYERGMIFEKEYLDFKRAAEYFGKARTEFVNSQITPLAQRHSEYLAKYFKLQEELHALDTLLVQSQQRDSLSARGRNDSTIQVSAARDSMADSTSVRSLLSDSSLVQNHGNDSTGLFQPPEAFPVSPDAQSRDSLGATRSLTDKIEDEPIDVERPNPRKVREEEDVLTRKTVAPDTASGKKGTMKTTPSSRKPEDIRAEMARIKFELATTFFLEIGIPDSAMHWYREILEHHPTSTYVPKAMYGLAEVLRTLGDSTAVDSLYEVLEREYPESDYALHAKRAQGEEISETLLDSLTLQYQEAEEFLQAGKTEDALRVLKNIASHSDTSEIIAKSKYTIGWLYENALSNPDSAASWYRVLLKEHPTSTYATAAQPKIAVKDDPKTLQKYIKIKEIQAITRPVNRRSPQQGVKPNPQDEDEEPGINIRDRNRDRTIDEDEEPEEEPEEDTSSDDDE